MTGMTKRLAVASLAGVLAVTSAGCSLLNQRPGGDAVVSQPTQSRDQVQQAWRLRQQELGKLDRWTMQARAASGGPFGMKGQVRWQQIGPEFDVYVRGPFGLGAARLNGTPTRVRIRTADADWIATDPETSLRTQMGWTLPLSGLRQWALGLPADQRRVGPARYQLDGAGRITSLDQGEWTLDYLEYESPDVLALPRRITATHQDGTSLRLVVDSWDATG